MVLAGASMPQAVALSDTPLSQLTFGDRYGHEARLAEGGMGVIESCIDHQIGRRVAMKLMRAELAGTQAQARFLREARVQGQLEHPAVVPVYDLGVDPEGAVFFTMKRVRGVTLAEIVRGLRFEPRKYAARFSRRKLLTAFSNVCLAVDYAHEHGVIHRDIKPANIMLGDFGEVYLLDWGLARLAGQADVLADPASLPGAAPDVPPQTIPGQLLGTPGYMAPEQLAAEPEVGVASDVYALGSTLFEILALEPLHPGPSVQEIAKTTLRGPDARAALRAARHEVPPELEELVLRAIELDSEERLESARELHLAIERFLDGERDEALRREQAASHAREAERLAERAWEERGSAQLARRAAMREIGRTLALQPDNPVALDLMMQLLTKPPADLPGDVRDEIESSEAHRIRSLARIGAIAYALIGLYLPLILWCGVRSWIWVVAAYAGIAAAAIVCLITFYAGLASTRMVVAVIVFSNAGFIATSAFFGPFLVTPMIMAVNATTLALNSRPIERRIASAAACLSMVAAIALWFAGVVPGGYAFDGATMSILPGALNLPEVPVLAFLGSAAIGVVLIGFLPAGRVRDALTSSEQQLFVYAWHLRELVPEAVRGPTDPTGPRRQGEAP
jgi:serine/threonine-protein kinase